MNQVDPAASVPETEISVRTPPRQVSTFQLISTVTLRILGIRNKNITQEDLERLTAMQVGFACILALILFTAIMAILAILAVKYLE